MTLETDLLSESELVIKTSGKGYANSSLKRNSFESPAPYPDPQASVAGENKGAVKKIPLHLDFSPETKKRAVITDREIELYRYALKNSETAENIKYYLKLSSYYKDFCDINVEIDSAKKRLEFLEKKNMNVEDED